MTVNVDRITKLASKLGQIDTRINQLQDERTSITSEIQSLLGTYSDNTTIQKAYKTTPAKGPKGSLGQTIAVWLTSNPGSTIDQISKGVKTAANQVGLSLYHLTKKGQAFTENGKYFVTMNLATASKMAAPTDEEEEVPF